MNLREILSELRSEGALTDDVYQGALREIIEAERIGDLIKNGFMAWRPIAELTKKTRYGNHDGFLLYAPELVDLDCNAQGVGMGYWQDDRDVPTDEHGAVREEGKNYGGWLACKWDMHSDAWFEVKVTPTHFIRNEGPVS